MNILLLLFFSSSMFAMDALLPSATLIDTFTIPAVYRGARLQLTNIEVDKRKKNKFRLKATLVNTGKVDLDFSDTRQKALLQLLFDLSLVSQGVVNEVHNIRKAILEEDKLKLPVGAMMNDFELMVSVEKSLSIPEESLSARSQGARKENDRNPRQREKSSPEKVEVAFVTKTKVEEDELLNQYGTEGCPDLILDSVEVVNSSKKSIELRVRLSNVGAGPATVQVDGDDRIFAGLRTYLTGTPKLSRGAIPLGYLAIKDRKQATLELAGNSSAWYDLEVDLKKKTRYLNVLIISLESFLVEKECDRTNNTTHIFLED